MSTYGNRKYRFSLHGQRWWDGRRRRRQRRQHGPREIEPPFKDTPADQLTLQQLVHPDQLLAAFDRMKGSGGKAPGPDGLSYDDFSRGEMAAVLRDKSREILTGTYRPERPRRQRISKSSGGRRTLTIRNLADRIISKTIADALTAAMDSTFLPGVMGFRPKRGVWLMLAEMTAAMITNNCCVIAQCDIKDAFPHVQIADVLEDYRRHLNDEPLLRLIETILRGFEGSRRITGIDQGDSLSPLSLNLRLHYCLDRHLHEHAPHARHGDASRPGHPSHHRYADNLVFLCRDVSEGHQAIQRASRLLSPAGFSLKEEASSVTDLRRGNHAESGNHAPSTTTVLGFAVSRAGSTETGTDSIRYRLTPDSWKSLDEALMSAHQAKDPPRAALQAMRGWVAAWGPAFESERERCVVKGVMKGIRHRAARMGFRELDLDGAVLGSLKDAGKRWRKLRDRVLRDHQQHAVCVSDSRGTAMSASVSLCVPVEDEQDVLCNE